MGLKTAIDILVVLMPLLYGGLVVMYGVSFFGNAPGTDRLRTRLLILTVLLHVLYLALRTVEFDHPPVTTVYEIMTMLAACIAVAYAYIEVKTRARNTGFFILLLAFLFQAVSSLFIRDLLEIAPILRSRLLGIHVTTALLGYTAISLSAVYGLLYLML
jgi:ABC-type transport system involved in cytochrome c biogenesis permease subunit